MIKVSAGSAHLDEPALQGWLCSALTGRPGAPASAQTADWQRLVQLAAKQGVAPLLYHVLRSKPAGVHPAALLRLEQAYLQSSAYNTLLFHELARLMDAFEHRGVPVVVLKGAALAESLYPETGLRPMNDLDLLVQPDRLGEALAAARECGYHAQKVTYHAMLWGGPRRRVTVELHWNLLSEAQPAATAWFWEHRELWCLEGRTWQVVSALNPLANLLYLSSHLILQHGASNPRLVWFYDLHQLLTHAGSELDWQVVLDQARRLGMSAALLAALRGASQRFDSPIPDGVLAGLRHDAALAAAAAPAQLADETSRIHRWMIIAQGALGWRERLLGAWRMFIPRPEYMLWRYRPRPAWLWPLYYPLRWALIAWRAVLSLARLPRRGR